MHRTPLRKLAWHRSPPATTTQQIEDRTENVIQIHPVLTSDLARVLQKTTYQFKLFSANAAWVFGSYPRILKPTTSLE